MNELFQRLKQRKLVQWAVAYIAAAFALLQGLDIVANRFDLPSQAIRLAIVAMIAGLFVVLVLAWYHGERGAQKISGTELLIIGLVLAVGGGLLWVVAAQSAKPETRNHPAAPVAAPPSPATSIPEKSIAVLPFVNMSSDKEQDYFSDGLSEELLNQLAQVPQLRVIARTSSFSFKDKEVDVSTIAKALNVANVLEGSVRKSATTLRITAQLVRTSDSSHLWSQTYDRQLTDVFKVQDEIAREVVAALKVKLLPSEQPTNLQHTENTDAYEQYLIALAALPHGGREPLERAAAAARQAISLDPDYANAYPMLAYAQVYLADYAANQAERLAAVDVALATVNKGIALAPELSAGYGFRATIRIRFIWDWKGAESDFKKALELDPHNVLTLSDYAQWLFFSGHPAEALAIDRKTTTLDPLSSDAWTYLGWHLALAERYEEARVALLRSLELSPDGDWASFNLGYVYMKEGKMEKAREVFAHAPAVWRPTGLAMLEHTLGHEQESQKYLTEVKTNYAIGFAYQIAQVHAWRGERGEAITWLEKAYDLHDAGLFRLRYDPILASLRDDPRFAALVQKMQFAE
ncbi:MAG: hypothetical protein H0W43_02955 [Chthoniobacterales bacterium]|nr:hypothetical protein [Chthoniobacterales bacterium]